MYKSGVEPLVLNWNRVAMESLKENKLQDAFRMLQKAEEMLKFPDGSDFSKILAITNNNLGCYYKRIQKLPLALEYLFKALKVEVHNVYDKSNLAGTHLNICAVYSLMNQHEKALGHGVLAIKFLKEAYEEDKEIGTLTSLIIALNNTGFEYELLKDYEGAQSIYKSGFELASKNLGPEHPVTLALAKAHKNIMLVRSEQPLKKASFVKKKDIAKLPKIKSLSGRNKSLGSNTRFFSKENDNSSRGYRVTSNKTFDEKVAVKKHLPKIEKTATVSKRSKKILEVSKIHSLEEKITELQNQIVIYQQKYKQLEEKSLKPKLEKTAAAIKIQRFWRKKLKTKLFLLQPIIPTEIKTRKAKIEFDHLKSKHPKELPYNQAKKPLTSSKATETNVMTFHQIPNHYGNNRIQRTILMPLDPIRESKIETKEMKAILIQSSIRGFLAKRRYEKMKHSAIKIQSAYRRYQCSSLFQYIRKAALTIQSKWRNYHKNMSQIPSKKKM